MANKIKLLASMLACGFAFSLVGTGYAYHQSSIALDSNQVKVIIQHIPDLRQSYYLIRKSVADQTVQKLAFFYHNLWEKSKNKKTGLLYAFAHEMAIEPAPTTPMSSQQQQLMLKLQETTFNQDAEKCWKDGLKAFPDSAEAAIFNAYRLQNRPETFAQSVIEAQRAVKLDSKWAYAYRILATSLSAQRDVEQSGAKKNELLQKSYQAMLTAQRLDEESVSKLFVATIYEARGDYKTALFYLDLAIDERKYNLSASQKEHLLRMRKYLADKTTAPTQQK